MEITKSNQLLLELIQNNTETPEICKKLRINNKQLKNKLNQLKRAGFNIQRQFFYNGTSKYQLVKKLPEEHIKIHGITNNLFRAVAISDLHFGSKLENLDYIKKIYEYCVNNDIHIILNGGDLIEGKLGPRTIENPIDQIEYLLENYPHDPNILNFITLGNHDENPLNILGIDIHTIINENREDLISLGYGTNKIKIKDDFITMAHTSSEIKKAQSKLKICGHGHRFQVKNDHANNQVSLYLATASNDIKGNFLPGMTEINLSLNNKKFSKAIFTQYIISDNLYPASNITHLFQNKNSKTLKK